MTYLTGGTHHSVAVEFRDYIALVEAPLNQARTLAVFNAVREMYPNKPIKYVVNSHNHFDHLGGIRTAFHEGATIVTHSSNTDFYKNEVLSHEPWTLGAGPAVALSADRVRRGLSVRDRGLDATR